MEMTQDELANVSQRMLWTTDKMALLAKISEEFKTKRPFAGLRIGVSLHLEPKTAVLLLALKEGGADVVAAGNYGTTQDDVAAYLRANDVDARGRRSDSHEEHLMVVRSILDSKPDILLDNGADLARGAIDRNLTLLGGTEETTSGHNLLAGELAPLVNFPVIVINDSPLKALVENKHAVGQSVYESFCRHTNLMPQGKRVLVVGYGWCGRGIAHYMRANGCEVSVAEIDEVKAMEAALDGFRVTHSVVRQIAAVDIVLTATGAAGSVIGAVELEALSDGTLLANAGHFDTEIDIQLLHSLTDSLIPLGPALMRHVLTDGRTVDVIAEGRMMNLAGIQAKGNTIESMDLGFSIQARSLERIATGHDALTPGAQPVPDDINRSLATEFTRQMGNAV
ncbi:MAG: adenosylhomocysteinase [Candidatus Poriferisodalaceae bacterium]|jgi:adenosylhomocysteinase